MYSCYSRIYYFIIIRPYNTSIFFFFNDTATTEIYTLSLHDALPICLLKGVACGLDTDPAHIARATELRGVPGKLEFKRSEEHTSELQSRPHLVCRLLLEKKKNINPGEFKELRVMDPLQTNRTSSPST